MFFDSSDNTAAFIGDPVQIDGTANTAVIKGCGSVPTGLGQIPGCTVATAGDNNKIVGVITSFVAATRDSTPYRAASTERIALVEPVAGLVFIAQVDQALAADAVGLNANIALDTAGNIYTGISGAEIDGSSAAAGAEHQLKIIRLFPRDDNPYNVAGNIAEVTFNLDQWSPGVGDVGA